MATTDYDAIVVGSGPNGLAAAVTLQQQGLNVLLLEAKNTIGGGLRTIELTLPGFQHDVCAAIHPLANMSPFFNSLPLKEFGLRYIHPPVAAAHPLEDGSAAVLVASMEETARMLGRDEAAYIQLMQPLLADWRVIQNEVLGSLRFPRHPYAMAKFGYHALPAATKIAKRFRTPAAKALWAGMAAHSLQPLTNLTTSAVGLVLMMAAHTGGWPLIQGGSVKLAESLAGCFTTLGGKIETNFTVTSLRQLPSAKAILLDVTPKQLLQIAGHRFSALYQWQLQRYRYGMGVFKIDWALDDAVPFTNYSCRQAGTVHIGNTFEEIKSSEQTCRDGDHAERPFVLLAQPTILDPGRAPAGKHIAWAYCHVPNGSEKDMTTAIENQVERFAPGFRERILARHTMNTVQLEEYNSNYIGGDINGGVMDIRQLFTRPALRWSPYRTSARGIYICSSSTPPGGGVHGMCGYHAARRALKDVFKTD